MGYELTNPTSHFVSTKTHTCTAKNSTNELLTTKI